MGRPVLKPQHRDGLETRAALLEFGEGLSREEAEEQAHHEYMQENHRQAAAHHLQGMRAAQATGDLDASRMHGEAYDQHLEALGHDSLDAVPPEIQALLSAEDRKPHYRFKAHGADALLIGPEAKSGSEPQQDSGKPRT